MNVKELVDMLKAFPDDWEVTITDGWQAKCFRGNFEVIPFEEDDGTMTVDIGIGGLSYMDCSNLRTFCED